jgi:guanosine-3',5'-bis(diphosphate) 3'-pyrophosphohydrolase
MKQFHSTTMLKAISFAARKHAGQLRKDDRTPYIAHPMRVLTILTTAFQIDDPEVLAAAVLHDTVEDTITDRDELIAEFGPRVADMVAQLSKDKRLAEEEREQQYYDLLAQAPIEVKLCKLADLYDNLVDAAALPPDMLGKTIARAQNLLELFAPEFPPERRDALERFQERIRAAIASLVT